MCSSDLENLYNSLDSLEFNHAHTIRPITTPIYASLCTIAHPTKISRPKTINTDSSMGAFLHSIAHIEYSAIDLALDATYRFRNLPREFYLPFPGVTRTLLLDFLEIGMITFRSLIS